MLTTREMATVIWLVAITAIAVIKIPGLRGSLRGLIGILLQPILLVPTMLYAAWMTAVVWFAAQVGVWQPSLAKDTLYWAVPGLILLFGATKVATEQGFFRRRVREAIGVSVFVAFYLGLATLDLPWELLLVPVLTTLSLYSTLGGTSAVSQLAGKRATAALGVIAIGLIVYRTIGFVQHPEVIDPPDILRSFLLPVWLTVMALPFVWTMSVLFVYSDALWHLRTATVERHVPWKSRVALVTSYRFRLSALRKFAGRWPHELAQAKSFREARQVIARQQAELKAETEAKQKAADDLTRYAGVHGLDARGRQLDKREFSETTDALEALANAHIGWYRSHGNCYQRDLLTRFGDVYARGLPEDHGITMAVSRSGRSWYAWRRTPSGLCFGIGAAGPPPDQRFYEGTDPPRGFPKVNPDWTLRPFERGPNWAWVDDPEDLWQSDHLGDGDE